MIDHTISFWVYNRNGSRLSCAGSYDGGSGTRASPRLGAPPHACIIITIVIEVSFAIIQAVVTNEGAGESDTETVPVPLVALFIGNLASKKKPCSSTELASLSVGIASMVGVMNSMVGTVSNSFRSLGRGVCVALAKLCKLERVERDVSESVYTDSK